MTYKLNKNKVYTGRKLLTKIELLSKLKQYDKDPEISFIINNILHNQPNQVQKLRGLWNLLEKEYSIKTASVDRYKLLIDGQYLFPYYKLEDYA